MQMNIDACEVDATHKVLYHVYPVGNDEDVLSSNVINGYMTRLVDDSIFLRSRPDERVETPFFRVFLTVSGTHRFYSRIACEYRRLNHDARFNEAVANIHENLFQVIKGNIRRGMLEYREKKAGRAAKAERLSRTAENTTVAPTSSARDVV